MSPVQAHSRDAAALSARSDAGAARNSTMLPNYRSLRSLVPAFPLRTAGSLDLDRASSPLLALAMILSLAFATLTAVRLVRVENQDQPALSSARELGATLEGIRGLLRDGRAGHGGDPAGPRGQPGEPVSRHRPPDHRQRAARAAAGPRRDLRRVLCRGPPRRRRPFHERRRRWLERRGREPGVQHAAGEPRGGHPGARAGDRRRSSGHGPDRAGRLAGADDALRGRPAAPQRPHG